MKLAILIQCHKNFEQVTTFIQTLKNDSIDFFIHVDRKSFLDPGFFSQSNVYVLPDDMRINVMWGTFSQVEATLNLFRCASGRNYDYYWLVSGQDFPLADAETILRFLSEAPDSNYVDLAASNNNGGNEGTNFDKRNEIYFPAVLMRRSFFYRLLRRAWVTLTGGYQHTFALFRRRDPNQVDYYFGSSWFCINRAFAAYVLEYIQEHPEYARFYRDTICPDESFFQTLLMNSPFKDSRKEYLHYIRWNGGNSPLVLTCRDLDAAYRSGKLMARKIDSTVDPQILPEMIRRLQTQGTPS